MAKLIARHFPVTAGLALCASLSLAAALLTLALVSALPPRPALAALLEMADGTFATFLLMLAISFAIECFMALRSRPRRRDPRAG